MAYQNSAYLKRQQRIKRDKFKESVITSLIAGLAVVLAWVLFVIVTA